MANYHQSVADATQRAYLQAESITNIFGFIASVVTRSVVEDSPVKQQLMDEANEDLDGANRDLARALERVESAQQKVLQATEASKRQDDRLKAMLGHVIETSEQMIEHQDYAANIATLAKGHKVLPYDEGFITWLLTEADGPKFGIALSRLEQERLDIIKQAIEQEVAKRQKPVDPLDPDLRTVL